MQLKIKEVIEILSKYPPDAWFSIWDRNARPLKYFAGCFTYKPGESFEGMKPLEVVSLGDYAIRKDSPEVQQQHQAWKEEADKRFLAMLEESRSSVDVEVVDETPTTPFELLWDSKRDAITGGTITTDELEQLKAAAIAEGYTIRNRYGWLSAENEGKHSYLIRRPDYGD